jgi:riboflavin kinase/FMN adenylyltransferase
MTAAAFIDEVLIEGLGLSGLVVGPDAAFGKGRQGNVEFMARELPARGVHFKVVSEFEVDGLRPSSREVRELLARGELPRVAAQLGRPFTISARVGHGDGRGRELGFPTANLVCGDRLLPRYGVYACWASFEGKRYGAVCNIGIRPTFEGAAERVEVHFLDMPFVSLYGKRLEVEFVARIREEKKFSGPAELISQIGDDVKRARELLA